MNKSLAILGLLATLSSPAWGLDRMINISASGSVDGDPVTRLTACTIVTGEVVLVVLAEAVSSQTNPLLGITWLHDGIEEPVASNNDWGNLPSEEKAIIVQYLRQPNRATDAAYVGIVSNTAMCAHAFEEVQGGPQGQINLQINHIVY